MRYCFFLSLMAPLFLFPLAIHSKTTSSVNTTFQETCTKTWMERISDATKDETTFKKFGEQYCLCASGKSLETEAEIEKAAHICMAETLLQQTMNTLQAKEGLNQLTSDKIKIGCINTWRVIYPYMTNKTTQAVTAYCNCSATKLNALATNQEKKPWTEKINAIATICATLIQPDKTIEKKQEYHIAV